MHRCYCVSSRCRENQGGFRYLSRSQAYRHAIQDRIRDPARQTMPMECKETEPPADYVHDVQEVFTAASSNMRDGDPDGIQQPEVDMGDDEEKLGRLYEGWGETIFKADDMPPETLIGELLLYYFEWMASNNATDVCAKGVHGLLVSILPADSSVPGWASLKRLLVQVHTNNVEKVDMCPNDHIAFVDITHPSMPHYKHAHRTKCPHPAAARRDI